jgi:5-methylcytosine-specific restriction endonuclease McrA
MQCEMCGTEFKPKRNGQRFCSLLCSNRWIARKRDMSGENNPNFGKAHSDEARAKIAAAARGRKFSDETRAQMSATRKGKPKSEAWRKAISEAMRSSDSLDHAGEKNANFKHGRYVDERVYRNLVDLERCAECGATGVVLDVHHIDENHQNNDPANLMVLCHTCHGKKHGRPVGVKESRPRAKSKHAVLR